MCMLMDREGSTDEGDRSKVTPLSKGALQKWKNWLARDEQEGRLKSEIL